jgi:dolichyl-phosphate-mannose--protein O-mannosyl transferase
VVSGRESPNQIRTLTHPLHLSGFQYVTCGSALKLANSDNNVRLHSHDVKYGSGSGQQVRRGL